MVLASWVEADVEAEVVVAPSADVVAVNVLLGRTRDMVCVESTASASA